MPLAPAFLVAAGDDGFTDVADLEARLARALGEARAAWPGVSLPEDAFVAQLGARVPRGGDRTAALDALHVADLYLACACARGDRAALEALERTFFARVGDYVARVATDRAFVDEVSQALREKLLLADGGAPGRIASYGGQGALGGWLRIAAVRTALNLRRASGDLAGEPDPEPLAIDGELAAVKGESRRAFAEALREALGGLPVEDRNLIRLHHLDGLTFDQLARVLGAPRSTLARRLARLRETILTATRARLAERLRLPAGEVDSLIGLAVSQFDLTLSRILG